MIVLEIEEETKDGPSVPVYKVKLIIISKIYGFLNEQSKQTEFMRSLLFQKI